MKVLLSNRDAWLGVLLFWNSILTFLFLNQKKHRWLDLFSLSIFVLYCIGILAFEESIDVKLFIIPLILSTVVIRFLIIKKRQSISQVPPDS